MAYESLRTATLNQRLLSTGSDTTIQWKVPSDRVWGEGNSGIMLIGSGESAEFVFFADITTGATSGGVTLQTATGCVRGIKFDADTTTDASNSYKKDHKVGDSVRWILHSSEINLFPSTNGSIVITGTLTFDNDTTAPFILPVYTTVERDALTGVANGSLIYNSTLGATQIRAGGNWVTIEQGTPVSFASESAAGIVQFADTSEKNSKAATDTVTGAPLVVQNNDTIRLNDPSNLNTTNEIGIGANSTGNRDVKFGMYADATNTAEGSFYILRLAATAGAANADTSMVHEGTGNFNITAPDGGNITLSSTGGIVSFNTSAGIGKTYTAGATLSAGVAVYYDTADGEVKAGANSAVATARIIGITLTGSTDGNPILVQETGVVYLPGLSMTAGTQYYLSNSAGAFTTTPTINSASVIPMLLGRAISPTLLQLNLERIPRRLTGTGTQAGTSTTANTITVGVPVGEFFINYGAGQTYAGTTSGITSSGFGYWNNTASSQNYITTSNSNNGTGNVNGTITTGTNGVLIIPDMTDSGGSRRGVATVDGSNNVILTWTDASFASDAVNAINFTWRAVELV